MKLKYAAVHLLNVGSSHPEVDVKYCTTRKAARNAVQDMLDRTDPDDVECIDDAEWSLGDCEGWIRIDEVK